MRVVRVVRVSVYVFVSVCVSVYVLCVCVCDYSTDSLSIDSAIKIGRLYIRSHT